MAQSKPSLFRSGSELLDDLNSALKKAEDGLKRALKEEPNNAKKIARSEEIVKDVKRMIAEKEKMLGIKSKSK
jgi:hypothetical protein